jgi:hypothetical protein
MTPVLADITEPIPLVPTNCRHLTGVLLSPVFVEGGARRRRVMARWGYLASAACLAYAVMLGVSLTASSVSKPGSVTKPAAGVTGAGTPVTSPPRPARALPAPRTPVDRDAAQDTSPVLRLALPLIRRPALPNTNASTRPVHTTRSHRDNDGSETTRASTISRTPAVSSVAAAPTKTGSR